MKGDDRPQAVGEHLYLVAAVPSCVRHLRVKPFENLERRPFASNDRSHVVRDVGDDCIEELVDQRGGV